LILAALFFIGIHLGIAGTVIRSEILDRLVALVAKSLVAAEADRSGTRLRLLATTRAYAFEKLLESGEVDAIVRRQEEISQYSLRTAA
jgi:predicted ATPase